MNVLVYLGSNLGDEEYFRDSALEIANWIGDNKYRLIYGGNENGLMGVLAGRALEKGSEVIGVMPRFLIGMEKPHKDLTEFIEVDTMSERKDYIRSISDICIALPGGPGTMEEITEAISLYRVKQSDVPCVFYNKNGYYNHMKEMYDLMLKHGFMTKEERDAILFTENVKEIEEFYKRMKK